MSALHTLSNVDGARIDSFRKGRRRGSGNGKTAGKGMKGQGAHAHTKKNGYEGGQTPIARRLPKFGFRKSHKNRRIVFATVNLEKLNVFNDGDVVNAATLLEKNIVKKELNLCLALTMKNMMMPYVVILRTPRVTSICSSLKTSC